MGVARRDTIPEPNKEGLEILEEITTGLLENERAELTQNREVPIDSSDSDDDENLEDFEEFEDMSDGGERFNDCDINIEDLTDAYCEKCGIQAIATFLFECRHCGETYCDSCIQDYICNEPSYSPFDYEGVFMCKESMHAMIKEADEYNNKFEKYLIQVSEEARKKIEAEKEVLFKMYSLIKPLICKS